MRRFLASLALCLLLCIPLLGAGPAPIPTDTSSDTTLPPSVPPLLTPPYPMMSPPTLISQITFDPNTQLFTYSYQLTDNPSSTAYIDSFQLDIARRNLTPVARVGAYNNPAVEDTNSYLYTLSSVQNLIIPVAFVSVPALWTGGIGLDQSVHLDAPSIGLAGTDTHVNPGQTVTFSIVSKGLPGPRNFRVRQWISLDAVAFPGGDAVLNGAAFQGPTVGPSSTPANCTTPECLIGFLATLKDQAFTLGWIDNQGVANSLDQKLANARTAAQDGNLNAAGNLLHASLDELSAQHGKHVNDSAYFMLAPSAEYILSQMAVH